jgi:signal transduction histidine kinase
MSGGAGGVYCDDVRSRALAAGGAALGALWAARSWRATLHALTGLMIEVVTAVLLLLWLGDIVTLIDGPGSDQGNAAFYVVVAVIAPVPLLWWLGVLSAVQRVRFRTVLGVEIPQPPQAAGRWPWRLARAWGTAAAWRQLGYHLLAPVTGLVGGVLVAVCWSAPFVVATYPGALPVAGPRLAVLAAGLLLAAPWVARGVARADEIAARALLGPSPAQELAQRVDTLARSRAEIVAAADAERRRIERDLHDGAQQQLVSLALNLGMARAALGDVPQAARRAIEAAHEDAIEALAGLRELVRGLHPAVLNDRGLDAALSGIVARAAIPVRLRIEVATRCGPSIEAIAYFTVSEALTNIARHARATRAEITVERAGDRLRVVVTDDGCGGASPGGDGSGLRGLAQRAAAVDGALSVHSPAGGPTTITVELPCE